MRIAALLILGAAVASIKGLPFDSRTRAYDDWRDTIELARNQTGVPGLSVAVLHKGKVIFAEGFGKRNDKNEPVTAETLMPIASMTKAMTAAMIGELVAEGKLDWDKTPVVEYVPEAKYSPVLTSELTLSDYLSHRTGLPHEDDAWTETTETRAQVFRRLKHLKLSDKLSSKLQYSNVGYSIAGEAAANVAGLPYEHLVRNKIFRPLGLTHTEFSQIEMGKRPNHGRPFYADSLKDAQAGKFHEGDLNNSTKLFSAAGDIYSNTYDLLKWGRTIMKYGELDGKQVLNKEAVQEQLTAHTIFRSRRKTPEFSPAVTYGLGWFMDSYKGQAMYYHGGNVEGFSSNIVLFPDSDLVIAILTNIYAAQLPNVLPYYLADEILNLPRTQDWTGKVALELTNKVYDLTSETLRGNFPPRLKNKPAAHPLYQYEGVYKNPLFAGDVTITLKNEDSLGEDGFKKSELHFQFTTFMSKMEHYHYDTFSYILDMWSVKAANLLTFITGQDGQVQALEIEYLGEKWVFKKKTSSESSSRLLTNVESVETMTTTRHRCHDQEESDVRVEEEEEQAVFGQENVQFKLF
ncbi:hypothetical protein BG000_003380 [Podila horticola]|nr:hypothetical protein BG000_003380 [Podila horticola]